jgi:hypothetical protein
VARKGDRGAGGAAGGGRSVRRPIGFCHRNLVFGRDLADAWAVFRLETEPYAGMTLAAKRDLLGRLAGLAYALEADFQLLRVGRGWSVADYERGVLGPVDPRRARRDLLARQLEAHRDVIDTGAARPELYLAVNLEAGAGDEDESPRALGGLEELWRSLRGAVGLADPRALSERRLAGLHDAERLMLGRVCDYVVAERAASHELRWLIARAPLRSLGEPQVDERFRPQALIVEDEREGRSLRPLEHDLLRLADQPIELLPRSLRFLAEGGECHQALLVAGALPEETPFPGRGAEDVRAARGGRVPGRRLPARAPRAEHGRGQARAAADRRRRPRLRRGGGGRPRPLGERGRAPARGPRARGLPHLG